MLAYEDLWIKICDDFHDEINPILEQLSSTSKENYWYNSKSIYGKLFILNNVLLSLNRTELNQYKLTRLTATLEAYKSRITKYFDTHIVATCFVYFSPQNINQTQNFLFKKFKEYCHTYSFQSYKSLYIYLVGMELIGFPNDCSFKLTATIKNNKPEIQRRHDPLFEIEKERGKQIGNVTRTRDEQEEIEVSLSRQNPELYDNAEEKVMNEFQGFSELVLNKINSLLNSFDSSIELCQNLIGKNIEVAEPANLSEIQKIYNILRNGYFHEPVERFLAIFQNDYSGEKIVWLKDGAELRFFLDRIVVKITNAKKINQWADKRFTLLDPPSNFIRYIGDVKHKNSLYLRLIDGNEKSNPIYKLSKGF
jgi:hypothetical protein